MNAALAEFTEWATGNRLAAEPTKSQVMLCTARGKRKQEQIQCPECKQEHDDAVSMFDGHPVCPSGTMKILGVTIDNKLSWEARNA
eukprot:gene6450-52_t